MSEPSRALIVKSFIKDDSFIRDIRKYVIDIIGSSVGRGNKLLLSKTVDILSNVIYYWSTTAQCLQTLGEEYAGLIAVQQDKAGRLRVPGKMTLRLLALVQSLFPSLSATFIAMIARYLRHCSHLSEDSIAEVVHAMNSASALALSMNRSLFYLTGWGYRMVHRLLAVHYISSSSSSSPHRFFSVLFRVIGFTTLVKVVYDSWLLVRRLLVPETSAPPEIVGTISSVHKVRCALCLEVHCKDPTAAACGHVFCWHCIVDATRKTAQCPLCRARCHPSRLVYLDNL